MGPSLFLITLTLSLSSPGSIIQASHLLDRSAFLQMTGGIDIDNNDPLILAAEEISLSERDSYSVEGSGLTGDGTALKLVSQVGQTSDEKHSRLGITSTTTSSTTQIFTSHLSGTIDQRDKKANTSRYTHSSVHMISEEAVIEDSFTVAEEQMTKSKMAKVGEDFFNAGDSPKHTVQTNVFTSITNHDLSGPGVSCGLGRCVVLTNNNGTNLLWDDMRRTLVFAWELHVFGSASLFILIAVLAVIGTAGACTRPCPFCDALILANGLLILSGTLRGVLLLLDPYGTRQVLSRATLAALHNVPLQLLLWAQVALALVTLKGLNLIIFPLKLQRSWIVVVLAASLSTSLFVADLLSQTLSPALPLLLQTLSLCWGLPFCIVILVKSFSHLHPSLRSAVPQWVTSQRIDGRAKRVTAVCAFLGVLCCSLQMYSLLWLYGLLGNWRRFGWGWWLSQFWARILEISWGFSLLVLGSWLFWTPSMVQIRGDSGQSRGETTKKEEEKSLWDIIVTHICKGPLKKSETWEELMPNNWTKYNLTRTGFSNSPMCPYDNPPTTIKLEYKPDNGISSSESQAALLWQKKVSERDCILSLIEFDIGPPTPTTLRHNLDNAVHHRQFVAGSLFTAPPPSWSETVGRDSTVPTSHLSYNWAMDSEPKEPIKSPCAGSYCSNGVWFQATPNRREEISSAGMYPLDWSDDDVTDL